MVLPILATASLHPPLISGLGRVDSPTLSVLSTIQPSTQRQGCAAGTGASRPEDPEDPGDSRRGQQTFFVCLSVSSSVGSNFYKLVLGLLNRVVSGARFFQQVITKIQITRGIICLIYASGSVVSHFYCSVCISETAVQFQLAHKDNGKVFVYTPPKARPLVVRMAYHRNREGERTNELHHHQTRTDCIGISQTPHTRVLEIRVASLICHRPLPCTVPHRVTYPGRTIPYHRLPRRAGRPSSSGTTSRHIKIPPHAVSVTPNIRGPVPTTAVS